MFWDGYLWWQRVFYAAECVPFEGLTSSGWSDSQDEGSSRKATPICELTCWWLCTASWSSHHPGLLLLMVPAPPPYQIYLDSNAWESNSEKLLQHLGSYYYHGFSILWQGLPRLNESDVHLGWWCHEQDLASLLFIVSSWHLSNFCGRVCWDWMNLLYSFDAVKKTLILFYLLSVQLQMCMLKKLEWIHLQFLLMRTTSFLVLLKKVSMAQHGTFYLSLTFDCSEYLPLCKCSSLCCGWWWQACMFWENHLHKKHSPLCTAWGHVVIYTLLLGADEVSN